MNSMKSILARVLAQDELTREETKGILIGITKEEYPQEQIVALLTALQMRGITVDELLGFRDGILETGGDQKNTFNISTCACFVVAGAGYKVAKHGNYAATSVSGASNVIEAHGVKFTADLDKLNRSMDECNIVYLHAQLFAKAMKFVGPIRNASQPKCQLLGVANLNQMRLYNAVYQKLGIDYGIETSIDGYDEISLTSDFKVTTNNYEKLFKPGDIGLNIADAKDLEGGKTKEEAAKIFDSVLENTSKIDHKEVVIANAAFAIQIMDQTKSIEECVAIAKESIESGAALRTLNKFIALNS